MIAVIGEKPSVARDIARILGASEKQDGYLSGNGYLVTWAFGASCRFGNAGSLRHTELSAGKVCLLSRIVFNLHPDK